MAKSVHWSESVLLTPKKFQVNSAIEFAETDIWSLRSTDSQIPSISNSNKATFGVSSLNRITETASPGDAVHGSHPGKKLLTSIFQGITQCGSTAVIIEMPHNGANNQTDKVPVGTQANEIQDGNNAALEMVANQSSPSQEKTRRDESTNPLRIFLQLMYYMGMSTFNPRRNKDPLIGFKYFIDILIKMVFWSTVVLGFVGSFLIAKHTWLHFLAQEGILNFVKFGFRIITILLELVMVCLFGIFHGRISRMLIYLDEINEIENEDGKAENGNERKASAILAAMVIMTITVCFLNAGPGHMLFSWSFDKIILDISLEMRTRLFIWNTDDMNNDTVIHHLVELHGTNITLTNIMMSLSNMVMVFCSSVKLEIAIDLTIVAGWCLEKSIAKLAGRVENVDIKSYAGENDSTTLESLVGEWAHYERLSEANKAINFVLDGLLKVMHVYNAMVCAYFLMNILENKVTFAQFLSLSYIPTSYSSCLPPTILPSCHTTITLCCKLQLWIIEWAIHSKDNEFLQKAVYMVKKLEIQPLGLGRGDFIIGESFILKFSGMVGSTFMLQVDKGDGT